MEHLPANYEIDCEPVARRYAPMRLRSLDDLDGRTRASRLAQRLVAELKSDLGGGPLTCAQRELTKRAAMLSVMVEDAECRWLERKPVDLVAYGTLTDRLRRLLESLGLNRGCKPASRDVTGSIIQQFQSGAL